MRHGLALVLAIAALGCSSGVSTVGDTPAVAAEEVADAICYGNECPGASVSCTTTGDMTTCEGELQTIVTETERNMCFSQLSGSLVGAFEQADMAGVAREDIDACINATLDRGCITQAELDAYIAEREAGNDDAELVENPPECEALGLVLGG